MLISSSTLLRSLTARNTAPSILLFAPARIAMSQQQQPRPNRGRGGSGRSNQSTRPKTTHAAVQTSTSSPSATPQPQQDRTEVAPTVSTHLSTVPFASLSDRVDPRLLSAIPFPLMSEVQAATLGPALTGADLLARAKTGTGKTIAFLLPTLNRILAQKPRAGQDKISCLIMSPTRELALQIEKETEMLLKNVNSGGSGSVVGVQHVVGGTNMKAEHKRLTSQRCDILIATPGRLLDHLTNSNGVAGKFSHLQAYILDEADRMLDMGFRQELAKISKFLPNRAQVPRQALLFSATIPEGVREVADLDKNAVYVNTVSEEEDNTHAHVAQKSVIAPKSADIYPMTLALLLQELERAPTTAKVIVFAPTARAAGLAAELFRSKAVLALLQDGNGSFSIGEVHSRKSQAQRVKATKEFAEARRGILFSSDVAARGIDFPGVTAVFQTGLPASSDQYVHRIGRTGRAGAEGHSIIVLASWESYFLNGKDMKELPITPYGQLPKELLDRCRTAVTRGLLDDVTDESKAQAYQASLGYYKSELRSLRWNVDQLVHHMNEYASEALLYAGGGPGAQSPPLLAKTVGKMGLKGTKGLNIVKELPGAGGATGGRGGQGQGQGRGGASGRGGGQARALRNAPPAPPIPQGHVPGQQPGRGRGRGNARVRGGGAGSGAGRTVGTNGGGWGDAGATAGGGGAGGGWGASP